MPAFSRHNADQLRFTLQQATVKCSERCLYQSAKWYAGLALLPVHVHVDAETLLISCPSS